MMRLSYYMPRLHIDDTYIMYTNLESRGACLFPDLLGTALPSPTLR